MINNPLLSTVGHIIVVRCVEIFVWAQWNMLCNIMELTVPGIALFHLQQCCAVISDC